jgi:hypothetical protein
MSPLQGNHGDSFFFTYTGLTTNRYGGKMPILTACEQMQTIRPFHPNGRIDVDIAYNFKTTGIPLFAHR